MPISTPGTPEKPIRSTTVAVTPLNQVATDISGFSERFATPDGGGSTVCNDTPETSRIEEQDDFTKRKTNTQDLLGLSSPIYNLTISFSRNSYFFVTSNNSTLELDGFYIDQFKRPVIIENKRFNGFSKFQQPHTEHNAWGAGIVPDSRPVDPAVCDALVDPDREIARLNVVDDRPLIQWITDHGVHKCMKLQEFITNLKKADSVLSMSEIDFLEIETAHSDLIRQQTALKPSSSVKLTPEQGMEFRAIQKQLNNLQNFQEIKFLDSVTISDSERDTPFTRIEKLRILKQFLNPALHYVFCLSKDVFVRQAIRDIMTSTLRQKIKDIMTSSLSQHGSDSSRLFDPPIFGARDGSDLSVSFEFAVVGADEKSPSATPVPKTSPMTMTILEWSSSTPRGAAAAGSSKCQASDLLNLSPIKP